MEIIWNWFFLYWKWLICYKNKGLAVYFHCPPGKIKTGESRTRPEFKESRGSDSCYFLFLSTAWEEISCPVQSWFYFSCFFPEMLSLLQNRKQQHFQKILLSFSFPLFYLLLNVSLIYFLISCEFIGCWRGLERSISCYCSCGKRHPLILENTETWGSNVYETFTE